MKHLKGWIVLISLVYLSICARVAMKVYVYEIEQTLENIKNLVKRFHK